MDLSSADHIANILEVFDAQGFPGASPYQFISTDPTHPPIAGFDLSMASYGLVKVIRRDHTDRASRHNRAICDRLARAVGLHEPRGFVKADASSHPLCATKLCTRDALRTMLYMTRVVH